MLENNYLKIDVIAKTYAMPCIDNIGYDNLSPAIGVARTYFISAHAPSVLKIKFKKSEKIYINCNINRSSGIDNGNLTYKIKFEDFLLFNSTCGLEYKSFYVDKDLEYTFEIDTKNSFHAHTLWSFVHPDENLSKVEIQSLEKAKDKKLNPNSDYSLFIQTCNPRKQMALRCVWSFLNSIDYLPQKIVVCSIDDVKNSLFPDCVDFITGRNDIFNLLIKKGINSKCLNHIFSGFKNSGNPNMWLKYVIPRLYFDTSKVLVLDDDVITMGKCDELLESEAYLTFMDDDEPLFYGQRTIDFFNTTFKTTKYSRTKPFVCAGVYKINKINHPYDPGFINNLILASVHDIDEQAAVGMEIFDNSYHILSKDKYHHGGWTNQDVDLNKIDLIHMQGYAFKYRSRNYSELLLARSLNEQ